MENLEHLEKNLNISFSDYSLLLRALTHRSFVNENQDAALEDNERLEFLGDAVLDFIVGAYLYNRFPEMDEGELTTLRSALVKTRYIGRFCSTVGNRPFLAVWALVKKKMEGGDRAPILCAAFEAVIGAIYLDQGVEKVLRILLNALPDRH